jgi:hypothetical protein
MSNYFGLKATSGVSQPIIALMPPHDIYIEAHLCAMMALEAEEPVKEYKP